MLLGGAEFGDDLTSEYYDPFLAYVLDTGEVYAMTTLWWEFNHGPALLPLGDTDNVLQVVATEAPGFDTLTEPTPSSEEYVSHLVGVADDDVALDTTEYSLGPHTTTSH